MHRDRCIVFTVLAHMATSHRTTSGFLPPSRTAAGLQPRLAVEPGGAGRGEQRQRRRRPSASSLFLKVERYGYEQDEVSDEELFVELAEETIIRETGSANDYGGVREPAPSLKPAEIVPLIMHALRHNDTPEKDTGLMVAWDFSTDVTKHVFKHDTVAFVESCHETAITFPTSFYGVALYGKSWELETGINRVGGEDGWIATQVMKTISSDGRLRRWQWELRKNKRPPCLGCWRVESIASSDRNGDFEDEDFA